MEENITTLRDLGLTIVQAKAYLVIARAGVLNIAETSNLSKVPRTDLYRVLKELEEKGIVERIIANPTQFKAIPIDKCLDLLIQQRTAESLKLQKRAAKLRQNFNQRIENGQEDTVASRFILIPGSRAVEKIGNSIDSAKTNIDVAISFLRFSHGIFLYSEKLEKAWRRKVTCRFVVGLSEKEQFSEEQLSFFRKSALCRVKFVVSPIQTVLGVYDRNEIFIIENPQAGLRESPALWSNNSSLIALAKDYFEILWVTAMENPEFKTDN